MRKSKTRILASLLGLAVLLLMVGDVRAAGAQHVRWDIISLLFTTPLTINPGGFADATAPNNGGRIRLSGSGTFVAPAGNGGGSSAATGGGTWQTFSPSNVLNGSGTYVVRELVQFVLANLATPSSINNIAGPNEAAANGWAYLRIEFSDGSGGVLGVFCHGPGAPDGIAEGINVTKGFKSYTAVGAPAPLVDLNRTAFQVRQ